MAPPPASTTRRSSPTSRRCAACRAELERLAITTEFPALHAARTTRDVSSDLPFLRDLKELDLRHLGDPAGPAARPRRSPCRRSPATRSSGSWVAAVPASSTTRDTACWAGRWRSRCSTPASSRPRPTVAGSRRGGGGRPTATPERRAVVRDRRGRRLALPGPGVCLRRHTGVVPGRTAAAAQGGCRAGHPGGPGRPRGPSEANHPPGFEAGEHPAASRPDGGRGRTSGGGGLAARAAFPVRRPEDHGFRPGQAARSDGIGPDADAVGHAGLYVARADPGSGRRAPRRRPSRPRRTSTRWG